MLKLKLQFFGHLMRRTDPSVKTLVLGKIEAWGEGDDRGWDGWMALLTRWTWVWASSGSWWWTGKTGMLRSMRSQKVGYNWVTELTDCLWVKEENASTEKLNRLSCGRLAWIHTSCVAQNPSGPHKPIFELFLVYLTWRISNMWDYWNIYV